MDRNYYYEKMAKQRERELSEKAETRRLFDDTHKNSITARWVKQLGLGFAPIIIFLAWLLIHFLG